jgi:serine/threonine-protein kinase
MDQYIGRLLDNRYEILEILGTGGMAVVYKARCHRLNRLVAIKILKDEFARDEEFRRRFHAEGEAVAMLSHSNIVQVYDVSSTDSANYIVMELVSGISLRQYMEKKGVLNWKETLHFAMQIAKGLEHAHSRGIVHRDIKPHNVMVLKNGSVKVMDFGIARVMSKSNTLTKEALGSVHYISPEQAKGGYTDNRSDLYSLGVVMYEMMTGRPPYDGESPVAVAIQHINGGAAAPSTWNPNIPAGLEQIIMHGMELETKDRYASATEMLRDMDEFRKDPGIVFDYSNHTVVSGATQPLNLAGVKAAMTTAERVAVRRSEEWGQRNTDTAKVTVAGDGRLHTTGRNRPVGQGRAAVTENQRISEKAAMQRRRQREIEAEERRGRMTTVAIVVCSLVAVVAIIIFLIALFSGALFSRSVDLVDVPALEGEVYRDLAYYENFTIVTGQPEYSDDIEKGRIIRQEPIPGSRVEKGAKITVILSLGRETDVQYMEELRGRNLEDALRFLTGQGMNPLPFEEFSDEYAVGQVIRTNPDAGTPLTEGQKVEVYYSIGPMIETEKMPDLVGLNYATAMKRLNDLGFDNVESVWKKSDEKKDVVIAQSIPRYTQTDTTEKIVLTISEGPGVKKEVVPDVVGQPFKDAVMILNKLGFVNIEEEYVDSDQARDTVTYQSVKQGTEIDVNTKIILRVSKGPTETEAPTEGDKTVTRNVKIKVPDLQKTYYVEIWQSGKRVREGVKVNSGETEIEVQLTGIGIQTYQLYYLDGTQLPEPYDEFEVNFG